MKKYVIILSQKFPVTHPRKGEPTGFKEKVLVAINSKNDPFRHVSEYKIHTIRPDYQKWERRFQEVFSGKACLSLRCWTGRPYHSKQEEIAVLTKADGIGVETLVLPNRSTAWVGYPNRRLSVDISYLAHADGLSLEDWCAWFRRCDLSKPLAIIHFTPLRYAG